MSRHPYLHPLFSRVLETIWRLKFVLRANFYKKLKGKGGRCRNVLYEICVLIAENDLKHKTDLACEIIPFFKGILGHKPALNSTWPCGWWLI